MTKGNIFFELFMTYGWAILVTLVVAGALFYFGVFKLPELPEKFNPELHDCVEWRVDTDKCDTSSLLFSGISIGVGNNSKGEEVRLMVCHYGFIPRTKGESYSTAKQEFEDECVSWQPKQQAQLDAEYCTAHPSDSEKCECVNNTSVRSFEYRDINYSNTIEVNYFGYECKELIDDDSRYMLQNYRRKFVAVIPIKVERTYNCNLPCDGKGCYFETKCFEPLNQSLLKYKGIGDGFPVYCSSFGNTMRVTSNFTYETAAPIRIERRVCVEAEPKVVS